MSARFTVQKLLTACFGVLILVSAAAAQPDGRTHARDFRHLDARENVSAEEPNRILEQARAGDLKSYKAEFAANPGIVNLRWIQQSIRDNYGECTALHFASRNGDLAMVKFLLDRGAQVSLGDHCGLSPLHMAATREIALLLIAHGANVNDSGNGEMQPLHFAVNEGVAAVLLANGADVEGGAGQTGNPALEENSPLVEAAGDGRLDVVILLIKHGAKINANRNGWTSLYCAARNGHGEIVRLLIDEGANVNGVDADHLPLEAAIQNRHTRVVRILLGAGADLPGNSDGHWGILHSAVLWGCDGEIISMLIKAGAKVDAATVNEESRFITCLFDESIHPDDWPPVTGNRTPLHLAADKGNYSAAKALIAHGANIDAVTTDGETPLSMTRPTKKRVDDFITLPYPSGDQETVDAIFKARRTKTETENANRIRIADLIVRSLMNRK